MNQPTKCFLSIIQLSVLIGCGGDEASSSHQIQLNQQAVSFEEVRCIQGYDCGGKLLSFNVLFKNPFSSLSVGSDSTSISFDFPNDPTCLSLACDGPATIQVFWEQELYRSPTNLTTDTIVLSTSPAPSCPSVNPPARCADIEGEIEIKSRVTLENNEGDKTATLEPQFLAFVCSIEAVAPACEVEVSSSGIGQ
ncbi:MAG TPA: hypothetical protein VI895_04130 [Bdellovibrionota bacterium]|nr:hypothetical protein [Bdellovibrionota bacterium]